jgi:two-component system sensor histidine kinase QseC
MHAPQEDDDIRLQSLRQFPLDVAHDLRGPLAGIGVLAVVAQQHLAGGDLAAARQDLQRIADQAQSSLGALEALWRLADYVERPLAPHLCSLDEVAHAAAAEAVLSVQAQWPARRLPQLQFQPLGQARVDRGLVHVILVNLIGNALKFNLDRAEVGVSVRREDTSPEAGLILVVSDDGVGFETGALASTQPPSQPLGPADQAPGYGLGLSIVRRAAQRLGGRLQVSSSPGKGVQVRVLLGQA